MRDNLLGMGIGLSLALAGACSSGGGNGKGGDAAADGKGDANTGETVDVVADVATDAGPDGTTDAGAEVVLDTVPPDTMLDAQPDEGGEIAGDVPCVPSCEGKQCGPDGCGGVCGECPYNCECAFAEWECVPIAGCIPNYWFENVLRIDSMEVGDAVPGHALDVDGNPATCSPEGECQDGLDNALGPWLAQEVEGVTSFNEVLADWIAKRELLFLLDFPDQPVKEGKEFDLSLLHGEPVEPQEVCDWDMEDCDYYVSPLAIDLNTCQPHVWFDNAAVLQGHLSAGGTDAIVSFPILFQDGFVVYAVINMFQLQAEVVLEQGTVSQVTGGVLAGTLRREKIIEVIEAWRDHGEPDEKLIPEKWLVPGPEDMLDMLLPPSDMDTDDDGEPDALSVGLRFSAVPANVVGLAPYEAECQGP